MVRSLDTIYFWSTPRTASGSSGDQASKLGDSAPSILKRLMTRLHGANEIRNVNVLLSRRSSRHERNTLPGSVWYTTRHNIAEGSCLTKNAPTDARSCYIQNIPGECTRRKEHLALIVASNGDGTTTISADHDNRTIMCEAAHSNVMRQHRSAARNGQRMSEVC